MDRSRLVSTPAVYFRRVFSNPKDKGSFDFPFSNLISIYLVSMQMEEPIHERRKTPGEQTDGKDEIRHPPWILLKGSEVLVFIQRD